MVKKKTVFAVEGYEMLEKTVKHHKGTGSRVYVPKKWKKIAAIRVK